METKLTLKQKSIITLGIKQVKLEMETMYPEKFTEDNLKPVMLQAVAKTALCKNSSVALEYANNEIEKMFA